MRRLVAASGAGLAFSIACAGFACHAEVRPGETQGLGLMGAQVPDILKTVAADPYRAPAAPACETIPAELKALGEVLGADADAPRKHGSQAMKLAMGSLRGMVPYRGVVRFLTQADRRDRALVDATMAGFARRGFLRGLEANLQCAGPAAPAPVVVAVDVVGVPPPYLPAEPSGPPPRQLDLAALMLTGSSTAAPAAEGARGPGR